MSGQIHSLIIKSAQFQRQIDDTQRRRPQDFMRLMRLKLLRLRTKDRLRLLTAAAHRRPSADDSGGAAPASAGPAPHRSPAMVFPCL